MFIDRKSLFVRIRGRTYEVRKTPKTLFLYSEDGVEICRDRGGFDDILYAYPAWEVYDERKLIMKLHVVATVSGHRFDVPMTPRNPILRGYRPVEVDGLVANAEGVGLAGPWSVDLYAVGNECSLQVIQNGSLSHFGYIEVEPSRLRGCSLRLMENGDWILVDRLADEACDWINIQSYYRRGRREYFPYRYGEYRDIRTTFFRRYGVQP